MCGISGVLGFGGAPASPAIVRAMTAALSHRGPDGEGHYVNGPIGLGHRRLAILDPSPAGRQPMSTESGSVWITYNGEIYNFRELRAILEGRGHRFRSNSDTEVILRAYEEWGIECIHQFNGMFAFALWDRGRGRLWLVRDRLGIKPLFYALLSDRLLFASEIKALLCDRTFERRVDPIALHHYLSLNYVPAPLTLLKGVRQVLPGHYLAIDEGGRVEEHEYWDLRFEEDGDRGDAFYLEAFEALLRDAVHAHLVSDVPLGAFLSGGLDSSGLVSFMSELLGGPVKTFSVGFSSRSYSELGFARRVASACGTEHHERELAPDISRILPTVVRHAEEPTADASMVGVYYLAQLAREQVKLVLSGDGADEILAGYETYLAPEVIRWYRKLPRWVRRGVLGPLVRVLPESGRKMSVGFRLRRFVRWAELDPERAHAAWRISFDEAEKRRLYGSELAEAAQGLDTFDLYGPVFAKTNAGHPLNRLLYADTRFYLPNDMLVKMDRMGMAHGLEVRVPYLDHRVVELAARIPPRLKIGPGHTRKYLLKQVLRSRVPEEILRRRKEGFLPPVALWLDRHWEFVADTIGSSRIMKAGLFRAEAVRELLERRSGTIGWGLQVWGLLSLAIWSDLYLD
ncbi:MAG: asparagine synthase (glutamine-hydrolyzing) [Deltaproteobacteria bacterium]|nr:asparagine synthase (glutamine-hydrolyzing) [Deltaproteobacteria bacterium]